MLNETKSDENALYDRTWMVKARNILNRTQQEAASDIGISQSYYNKLENGIRLPNVVVGLKICKALGVSPDVWLNEKRIA